MLSQTSTWQHPNARLPLYYAASDLSHARSSGITMVPSKQCDLSSDRREGRAPHRAAFGWANTAFNVVHWMEKRPLADILTKDVLGMNAPRMLVAAFRSPGDLWDTARMEMANTSFTVFGTVVLAPVFRWMASKISGVSRADINDVSLKEFNPRQPFKMLKPDKAVQLAQKQLAHLAGAFGFLIPFAASFVATPYIRNAVTLTQTGTANFEEIIGLETQKHAQNQQDYRRELSHQLNMIKGINLAGMALGLVTTVALGLRAKSLKAIGKKSAKFLHNTFKLFRLGGNKAANQVRGDLSIFIWWLAPAYLGYIVSARSDHERREALIKTVNSVLWFTAFNRFVTKPHFGEKFRKLFLALEEKGVQAVQKLETELNPTRVRHQKNWFKKQLGRNTWLPDASQIKTLETTAPDAFKQLSKLKVREELASMAISVLMLATTPAVINLFLTRHKYNKEQKEDLGLPKVVNPSWVTIRQNPLYYLAPLSHE